MVMKKEGWRNFRKKPVIIQACRWFGPVDLPEVVEPSKLQHDCLCDVCGGYLKHHGWVETLEGDHRVCPGDWIVRGVAGEYYPVKPDIFDKTYEPEES